MQAWLRNLKCGDNVVLDGRPGGICIAKITRTTESCVWIGELKFSRSNGRRWVGANGGRILECTKERLQEIEAKERAELNRE